MSAVIHAQRAAHIAGAELMLKRLGRAAKSKRARAQLEQDAAEAYPITRPRILQGPRFEYKVEGGLLMSRYVGPLPAHIRRPDWKPTLLTPVFLEELKELFRNPNEVVG